MPTPRSSWRAQSSPIRPATSSAPSTPISCAGHRTDRGDALSNLGRLAIRLGQFDDAIAQYNHALKNDPTNTSIRLNLALAYYKSARPQLAVPKSETGSSRQVLTRRRVSRTRRVLPATGAGRGSHIPAAAAREMFATDAAYAYLLGTALLQHQRPRRKPGSMSIAYRRRRIGGSGRLLLGWHISDSWTIAPPSPSSTVDRTQRAAADRALPLRTRAPGPGHQESAERGISPRAELNVNDFEANLQMGHVRGTQQRFDEASTYLEPAVTIPARRSQRTQAAREPRRLQTGKTDEASPCWKRSSRKRRRLIEAHVQLATGYARQKRTEEAQRERESSIA